MTEPLIVSPVPINKAFAPQFVFLFLFFLSEVYGLDALEVARVFGVHFLFKKVLKSLWLREESEVLDFE